MVPPCGASSKLLQWCAVLCLLAPVAFVWRPIPISEFKIRGIRGLVKKGSIAGRIPTRRGVLGWKGGPSHRHSLSDEEPHIYKTASPEELKGISRKVFRRREDLKSLLIAAGTASATALGGSSWSYPLPRSPPPEALPDNGEPQTELDSFLDTAMEAQRSLRSSERLARIRSKLPESVKQREDELVNLRIQSEAEARKNVAKLQQDYESQGKLTQEGKLCATPFGVDVVGITELVALTGALVGGLASRRRKEELVRLNDQLRKINFALRKQARVGGVMNPGVSSGMLFNPDLNYAIPRAPKATTSVVTSDPQNAALDEVSLSEVVEGGEFSLNVSSTIPENLPLPERQCRIALKEGKQLLKRNIRSASVRFKKALMLAKQLNDIDAEKRASRGLGACCQRQNLYEDAIKYYLRAVELTEKTGGDIEFEMRDLYNSIAEVYADIGDTEKALDYYDRYLKCIGADTDER